MGIAKRSCGIGSRPAAACARSGPDFFGNGDVGMGFDLSDGVPIGDAFVHLLTGTPVDGQGFDAHILGLVITRLVLRLSLLRSGDSGTR